MEILMRVKDAVTVPVAILRGRVRASLAGTGTAPGHVDVLLTGLTQWMSRKGFSSIGEMRGLLSAPARAGLPAMERAGYVDVLTTARETHRAW